MRRVVIGLVCAVAGYALAAFAGYWLIERLSSNTHDRSAEAAMTSAFVCGPIGAITGFIAGFLRSGHRKSTAAAPVPAVREET